MCRHQTVVTPDHQYSQLTLFSDNLSSQDADITERNQPRCVVLCTDMMRLLILTRTNTEPDKQILANNTCPKTKFSCQVIYAQQIY